MKIEELKEEIKKISEPRKVWYRNIGYKLEDIIIIGLCTVICGNGNDKHRAYHVLSAFVAENQLTLGKLAIEEKTNEITAVPELLYLIDVKGDIVTVDAMSCQKKSLKG